VSQAQDIVEASPALLFFIHLWENRGLNSFVLIFTVAVGMIFVYQTQPVPARRLQ